MQEPLEHELSRLEARLADDDDRASVIDELSRVRRGLAPTAPFPLDELRIASPCKQRWADMIGDDRVRVCNGCDRPVFDLSQLTREEASAVLATRGITPCVRLRRRADGTVITADCPPGARSSGRRLAVMAGAIAGTTLLAASPAAANPSPDRAASVQASGRIEGIVTDAATGEPLIGATVVFAGAADDVAAITDEDGFYALAELPPGDHAITIYYEATILELRDVRVTVGVTTVANASLTLAAGGITISSDYTLGIPVGRSFGETLGVVAALEPAVLFAIPTPAPPPPPHRPTIEWSTWFRLGYGVESDQPTGAARVIEPQPAGRRGTWEAALGADVSVPLALHGDLRLGAWAEVRTSSNPVLGAEILVEALPRHLDLFQFDGEGILALRAGGNRHVVTAAIAYGYLAPWRLFGPWNGSTRYMIGVRLVVSANRSLDDPREWSATAGLEVEPVGAVRYLLGIRSWY